MSQQIISRRCAAAVITVIVPAILVSAGRCGRRSRSRRPTRLLRRDG